ncbi:hypothetical protein K440DRAFT_677985 [Wilcoxina mikolae CBS 423.85]|nr:hypothetical protein K440DRAFT_677985 [Wilcoxina mikolae CBS 423.85]
MEISGRQSWMAKAADNSYPPAQKPRPEFIPFTVPYLCGEVPYHNEGFWQIPERLGGKIIPGRQFDALTPFVRLTGHQLLLLDELPVNCGVHEKVASLQAWLFFSMLSEVLENYRLSIDIPGEFLVQSEDGKILVSTAALNGLSQRMLTASISHEVDYQAVEAIYRHANVCLPNESFESGVFSQEEIQELGADDHKVFLSIEILLRVVAITLECG